MVSGAGWNSQALRLFFSLLLVHLHNAVKAAYLG
jgi:hypothetical protein